MAGKFFQTLRELRSGGTLDDLDSAIAEVVSAVKTTGKAGELILKIKFRPPKKNSARYIIVEDDVVTKIPKRDRSDTVFYPLADNSLSKNDPDQMSLALRAVERVGSSAPPPDAPVDPDTGEVLTRALSTLTQADASA